MELDYLSQPRLDRTVAREPEVDRPLPGQRLLLAQHQIDRPTAADVGPIAPEMGQDVGVVAPGFFEGIRDGVQTTARRPGMIVEAANLS